MRGAHCTRQFLLLYTPALHMIQADARCCVLWSIPGLCPQDRLSLPPPGAARRCGWAWMGAGGAARAPAGVGGRPLEEPLARLERKGRKPKGTREPLRQGVGPGGHGPAFLRN